MKTTHKILNSGIARSSWLQLGMLGIVATFVMYVETMVIPAISGMFMQGNQTAIKGFSGLFPNSESYNFIFLTGFIVSVVTLALSIMIRKGLKIQTVKEELDDSNSINWVYELQAIRLKLIQGIRQFVILVFEQMTSFVKKLSSLRNYKIPSKKLLFLECEVNS